MVAKDAAVEINNIYTDTHTHALTYTAFTELMF